MMNGRPPRRGNIPPAPPQQPDFHSLMLSGWMTNLTNLTNHVVEPTEKAASVLEKRTRVRGGEGRRINQLEQTRGDKPSLMNAIVEEAATVPDPVARKRRGPEPPAKPQPAKTSLVGKHRTKKLEDITSDERIPSDIRQFLASLQK